MHYKSLHHTIQIIFVAILLALPQRLLSSTNVVSSTEERHQKITIDELLPIIQGAVELYDFLRNDVGVYADAARFEGAQFHPCSIASVGMGLVALCIADNLELNDKAEEQAVQTLRAMSGKMQGYKPARNPVNGFFRHWINMDTGAREWNSEYSSIDTAILISGALFCKMYFSDNKEIGRLADALYLSIDWNAAMANATSGEIYMTFDEQGRGDLKTRPFNEYMIVAWLAKNDPRANARTTALWQRHYENAADLPVSSYKEIAVLTDAPGHFLSNFVIQFPMYLCYHFTSRQDYLDFARNAMLADKQWWDDNTEVPGYVWGTGAGASGFVGSGYHADNFNNNPGRVCSPHVLAGFVFVDQDVANDALGLWNNDVGVYRVPGTLQRFLWRFSVQDPSWRAADVQGVDISTLLFGLVSHPAVLGRDFFLTYNNFNFPQPAGVKKSEAKPKDSSTIEIFPNPSNGGSAIRYTLKSPSAVSIGMYDVRGKLISALKHAEQTQGEHVYFLNSTNMPSGLYIVQLQTDDSIASAKILLTR